MEQHIKRLNLSFDMRRDKDRQAYRILLQHQNKTAFVINKILETDGGTSNQMFSEKNIIKQAIREVLEEMDVVFNKQHCKNNNEEFLPEEVFNIFESI